MASVSGSSSDDHNEGRSRSSFSRWGTVCVMSDKKAMTQTNTPLSLRPGNWRTRRANVQYVLRRMGRKEAMMRGEKIRNVLAKQSRRGRTWKRGSYKRLTRAYLFVLLRRHFP